MPARHDDTPQNPLRATSVIAPLDDPVARLCAGVSRGDADCLALLYRAKFDDVYSTARRITGRDEAFGLDVVQEVFLRVIRAPRVLRAMTTSTDLDRWLRRVTHTAALDLIRRERRRVARERRRAEFAAAADRPDDLDDLVDHLSRLLEQLDDDDRAALVLRAGGQSLANTGRALGSTGAAAHGRIRRALARLARSMKDRT